MAHAQKPDLVFQRKGRVYLNRRGSQFSRLLVVEECGSAVVMVVMLDRSYSEATHSIRLFPLHFPSRASPCATRFQLSSSTYCRLKYKNIKQINPYPTAFPYGNGMVLHFYQQQESSTTKTVHKVINKGLKAYV